MKDRWLLSRIRRARHELDLAAVELSREMSVVDESSQEVDSDLAEVRARIDALEQRVDVIEARAR